MYIVSRNETERFSFEIPVGDPILGLEIRMGNSHISTWANTRAENIPKARLAEPLFRSMRIRENRPFILDFSNRPEVLFALAGCMLHRPKRSPATSGPLALSTTSSSPKRRNPS